MESKRKKINTLLRKSRIRSRVKGTGGRPRLSVSISNRHVKAQLIDDETHRTLVSSSSVGRKTVGALTERATMVGTELAKQAKKAKITKVVLDRNARKYHGRVAALAEAARKEGLEF